MNFKKIDRSTIKCYVSNEEMEAYGITVEELMTDKGKARKFINYLLEQARDEIGQIEINSMMTIQIQTIRDKGLLLTITSNFWSELPRELKESLIESMEEHLHQVEYEEGGEDLDGELENADRAVFLFQTLDDVLTLCRFAPKEKRICSSLLKDQGQYYLCLWEPGKDREEFHRFCTMAMEYGTLYCAEKKRILLLQGRAECLIEVNAVEKLHEISEN